MMPLNHGSMMKVLPSPGRMSESGQKIIVPKLVIRSPAICSAMPSAVMP